MRHFYYILLVFLGVSHLFTSCKTNKKEKPDETVRQLLPDAPAEVAAIMLGNHRADIREKRFTGFAGATHRHTRHLIPVKSGGSEY